MPTAVVRRRRVKPDWTWVAIGVAFGIHALVAVTVFVTEANHEPHLTRAVAAQEPELATGCFSDAALASAARATMCLAPWHDDTDACLADAQMSMWLDQSSCYAQKETKIAEFAMLDHKTAAAVKSIDPEPLLEALNQPPPKPVVVPPPKPDNQPPPPPPPPPAMATPKHPMQVVETAKPSEEKAPDNARFLAEYDTNVKKNTVARGSVKEPITAKSKDEAMAATSNPKEASVTEHTERPHQQRATKAPEVPGTLAMRTPGPQAPAQEQQDAKVRGSTGGASGMLAMDGYAPRKGQGAIEQQQHDRSELPRGDNGAGGGAPDTANLKPSQEVLERALGGGNVDHMDDVDTGDETALSAKRWVYASFFNRMKRQVAQNWDPATVWRRSDPEGKIYGAKTRITEVRVTLSATGALLKIIVTAPSGLSDLDDEAVRSFHAAAPFPNPPSGLAASDGNITFAFSFFFEIGQAHTAWHSISGS
jgi:TonB family protein